MLLESDKAFGKEAMVARFTTVHVVEGFPKRLHAVQSCPEECIYPLRLLSSKHAGWACL
jgi:hypothetical protein